MHCLESFYLLYEETKGTTDKADNLRSSSCITQFSVTYTSCVVYTLERKSTTSVDVIIYMQPKSDCVDILQLLTI